ncbi:MAG: helix-turn-helix domain-containing protein [Candidatus Hydrothermarchaeaceae archaeon]
MASIVVKGDRGEFEIDLEDSLQKRYELVRELKLSAEPKEEICKKYGYSRIMGYHYEKAWDEKGWKGLMDKPKGPKTKTKRTEEVEKRVLDIRFKDPEKDMYDIADILKAEGYEISARSVARVLSEHGVTLKKTRKRPSQKPRGVKVRKKTRTSKAY